ncbi:FprA family A-type flavoprotein, partial [archaeon]
MKRTSRIFTEEISENFYLMRIDDKETLFFESLWYIPEGITYNAYLMLTDGGNILFDAWKHAYSEQFIETLKNIVDARDIDYIVIHHTEPDHSGSLPKLLEENGFKAEIIGNPLSKTML